MLCPYSREVAAYANSVQQNTVWLSSKGLVEVLATASSSTCAGDFVILYGEFVVIGQLLPTKYSPQGKDDDVFLTQDVHHTRVAVGLCGSKLVTVLLTVQKSPIYISIHLSMQSSDIIPLREHSYLPSN